VTYSSHPLDIRCESLYKNPYLSVSHKVTLMTRKALTYAVCLFLIAIAFSLFVSAEDCKYPYNVTEYNITYQFYENGKILNGGMTFFGFNNTFGKPYFFIMNTLPFKRVYLEGNYTRVSMLNGNITKSFAASLWRNETQNVTRIDIYGGAIVENFSMAAK
jgi:hypothetical protein